MTNKRPSEPNTVFTFNISTLLTIIFMFLGVVFSGLGFFNSGDSRVSAILVTVYLFIGGALFAAQFVHGIRREEGWQRVIAIIAAILGVFAVVMAVAYYQILTQVQMPSWP